MRACRRRRRTGYSPRSPPRWVRGDRGGRESRVEPVEGQHGSAGQSVVLTSADLVADMVHRRGRSRSRGWIMRFSPPTDMRRAGTGGALGFRASSPAGREGQQGKPSEKRAAGGHVRDPVGWKAVPRPLCNLFRSGCCQAAASSSRARSAGTSAAAGEAGGLPPSGGITNTMDRQGATTA